MLCTQCGAQLPAGSRFCSKCGANLSTALQEVTPSVDGVQATEAPTPKRTNTKRIVIAAVIAAILIIGVGGGIFAYLTFFTGTPIDEAHFPDEGFRNYVTVSFDADGDGRLSEAEVIAVNTVDLSGITGVADVTGIAEFTELQSFNLGANTVEEVDLSSNSQVTQVSTSNGRVESIQLPDGFNMQDGLDGAVDAEVSAGDVVIQAGEWTTDNGGRFGMMQRYNGTMYAGLLHSVGSQQLDTGDSTPFFGKTNTFHIANGKAYWLDNASGNGDPDVSLHSADINGDNQVTIADSVRSRKDLFYAEGFIYFCASNQNAFEICECYNTATGEGVFLPENVRELKGVIGNRALVALKPATGEDPQLALYNPITNELVKVSSAKVEYFGALRTSKAGILVANRQTASLYSLDASPVWSDKPLSEADTSALRSLDYMLYMDDAYYYMAYETDAQKHDFAIEKVKLSTNEHTFVRFNAPDPDAVYEGNAPRAYARILAKDDNSLILEIELHRQMSSVGTSDIYRVSLEDGKAELLQSMGPQTLQRN